MKDLLKKILKLESEIGSIKSEVYSEIEKSENNIVFTTRQIRILLTCLIEYHRYKNIRLDEEEKIIEDLLNKYL